MSRRRSLDLEYNSRTFGQQVLGVHGVELPKFADHCKEYWGKAAATCESEAVEERPRWRLRRASLEVAEKPNLITQSPVAMDVFQPRVSDFTDSHLKRRNQELQRESPAAKKVKKLQPRAVVFVRRLPKFSLAERFSGSRSPNAERVRTAGFKRPK